MKITSIVSYAVRQLVNPKQESGIFSVWDDQEKHKISSETDRDVLDRYVSYCCKQINVFLSAVKAVLGKDVWTTDKSEKNRVLTTTHINGFIICIRLILENGGKTHAFDYYKTRLTDLPSIKLSNFKSSRYKAMGQAIYDKCFKY